ncbi:MAG: hypothetical protein A2Y76_12280 [Planctomycetes bacterium RBG_13_60_9]|nr:MAG: hypothetical protein A2Y76_12280 [Planctomycetes bacterium RBG_13_60_9]
MSLGIDKNNHIIYEGYVLYGGRALFPAPHLFAIAIAETPEEALDQLKQSNHHNRLLFREDEFDPVSMVRRGRVYEPNGSQPTQCCVCPIGEVELSEAKRESSGVVRKQLFCYERYPLCVRVSSRQPFAAIGTDAGYSIWRIVSNDRTYFDEELVTMRPLYFLGAIPDLAPDNIPEPWRTKVQETVGKVVDSMYRANADSIVELCRHAASASLFAHFHEQITDLDKTDLGRLAKRAEEEGLRLVGACGKTVADLHSRIKPNMQMQHNLGSICDRDAELAVQCLSFILRDLGYTRSQ